MCIASYEKMHPNFQILIWYGNELPHKSELLDLRTNTLQVRRLCLEPKWLWGKF